MKVTKIVLASLFAILMIVTLSQSVSAQPTVTYATLQSREDNNATTNLGSIIIGGTTFGEGGIFPFSVKTIFGGPSGYSLTYVAHSGYVFVKWETSGALTVGDPNAVDTTATISGDDGTLTAVYKVRSAPSNPTQHVGGELFTANKPAILAPYLALISVVAVAAVVIKHRKI